MDAKGQLAVDRDTATRSDRRGWRNEPHRCESGAAACTVYLMRSLTLHKIGITFSPSMRLRGLQNSAAAPVDIVASVDACCSKRAREIEIGLHNRFDYCRRHGEWFELDASDVRRVIRFMKWPWLHRSLLKRARPRRSAVNAGATPSAAGATESA